MDIMRRRQAATYAGLTRLLGVFLFIYILFAEEETVKINGIRDPALLAGRQVRRIQPRRRHFGRGRRAAHESKRLPFSHGYL